MVEVLCALVVISIGLLALAPAIQGSATLINRANVKTKAVFLAQQRFEQVKNRAWTATTDCLGVSSPNAPATTSWTGCPGPAPTGLITLADEAYNAITGYPNHRRTVRIIDCGVAPGCTNSGVQSASLRQVTVSVFFRPFTPEGGISSATEESTQFTTLIARR